MPLSVGASPDDVDRLIAMLRVVGRFGHQLGRICDDCVTALEELSPAGDNESDGEQQATDDRPPSPPAD